MKYKAMKFWIGESGDESVSNAIRNILGELGYDLKYSGDGKTQMILTRTNGSTDSFGAHPSPRACFDKFNDYEEINIDWMRTIKPETITIEGLSKTYIKSELEEALRHIKPVGEE